MSCLSGLSSISNLASVLRGHTSLVPRPSLKARESGYETKDTPKMVSS